LPLEIQKGYHKEEILSRGSHVGQSPIRLLIPGVGFYYLSMAEKTLYYGDNLEVMREHIRDDSVDVIYLDPPFNSNKDYNVLFREPGGAPSEAQITAFEDTWHWNHDVEGTFRELIRIAPSPVVDVMNAFLGFAGRNDVTAYLAMMAIRLLEMKRILRDTGSIFLHCDPGVSHYLKILMDAIFGKENFGNEIIWSYRRWPAKARRLQRMHDVILFYAKDYGKNRFMVLFQAPTESSQKRWKGKRQQVRFGENGLRLPTSEIDEESLGVPLNDVWEIPIIAPSAAERLSYPTQKPEALLEKVISISTYPGEAEVIFDPFCGCGTAVAVAEKMGKQWIGIDITYLAINLIEWRLKNFLGLEAGKDYRVIGKPVDLAGAKALAKQNRFQFQWWTLSLVNAKPHKAKKKGADTGIDGIIYFLESPDIKKGAKRAIVSVKSGAVGVKDARDLAHVIERESCPVGILITLEEPTKPMIKEAASCGFYHSEAWGKDYPRLQILTVKEILNGARPVLPHVLDYRGL